MVDVAQPPTVLSSDALDKLFASSDDEDAGPSIIPDIDRAQITRDAQRKARQSLNMPEVAPTSTAAATNQAETSGQGSAGAKRRREDEEGDEPKRRVMAKIDAERLLGEYGFPALVQQTKNFKPKGKGHEKEDLDRVMTIYQLWAHRMFPKRRFIDTVERVEKVCRERRMLVALSVWRDELNPNKPQKKEPVSEGDGILSSDDDNDDGDVAKLAGARATVGQLAESRPSGAADNDDKDSDDEEIWAEILSRMEKKNAAATNGTAENASGASEPNEDLEKLFADDDDAVWDEMMREEAQAARKSTISTMKDKGQTEDEDALWDEMMRGQEREDGAAAAKTTSRLAAEDEDEDEMMALMREAEEHEAAAKPTPVGEKPSAPSELAQQASDPAPPAAAADEDDWERLYD